MKTYNIEHLSEWENINEQTECLCQKVSGKNRKIRIHNHEFYEVFLTLSPVNHFINGKNEKLDRGTLVFIRPSDIHGIIYDGKSNCEIINLSFSARLLGLMTGYLAISQTFIDNLHPAKILLGEFETQKLAETLDKIAIVTPDPMYIRCVLFELVTMFLKQNSSEKKLFPEWFENMCSQMKEKDNFIAGTRRMTEITGKSREYISRSVKKYLGITSTDLVNDLRLNYAASQIINSSQNITDICLDAGFFSISWFNKLFIQKYGMSPQKFRRSGHTGYSIFQRMSHVLPVVSQPRRD